MLIKASIKSKSRANSVPALDIDGGSVGDPLVLPVLVAVVVAIVVGLIDIEFRMDMGGVDGTVIGLETFRFGGVTCGLLARVALRNVLGLVAFSVVVESLSMAESSAFRFGT